MKKIRHIFLTLTIALFSTNTFAYETSTHELITEKAIGISTNYQKFNNDFGTKGNQKLKNGSIQEDIPSLRAVNHFFDPFNIAGLNISGGHLGRLSKEWGFDGGTGFSLYLFGNDYSWTKAREYEYIAFTGRDTAGNIVAPTQTERDNYFQIMYRSVGQIMHLIQDLAQPSHTRNDAHLGLGDPSHLEDWAINNNLKVIDFISPAGAPKALNSYDTYFIDLARFSNQNFFSDDTIFTHYTNPSKAETNYGTFTFNNFMHTITAEDGKVDSVAFLTKTGGAITGYKIAQMGYFAKELSSYIGTERLQFHIDDVVAKENAAILIPKAVEYSAGILDYFFRGKMGVDPVAVGDTSMTVNNLSGESMAGNFELYYDSAAGVRSLIQSWNSTIPPGQSSVFNNLNLPADFAPGKENQYLLVFQGQLGAEQNAVAGVKLTANLPPLYLRYRLPDNTFIYWDTANDAQVSLINPVPVSNSIKGNLFYQNGGYGAGAGIEQKTNIGVYQCGSSTRNIFELTRPTSWFGTDEGLVFIQYVDAPIGTVSAQSGGSAIRDPICWTPVLIYTGLITTTRFYNPARIMDGRIKNSLIGTFSNIGDPSIDANPKVIFGVSNTRNYMEKLTYQTNPDSAFYYEGSSTEEYSLFATSVKNRTVLDKRQSAVLGTRTSTFAGFIDLGTVSSYTGNSVWLENGLTTTQTFKANQLTAVGYFRMNGPPPAGSSTDGDILGFLVSVWTYDFDGAQFTYNSSKRLPALENFLSVYAPNVPLFTGIVTGTKN